MREGKNSAPPTVQVRRRRMVIAIIAFALIGVLSFVLLRFPDLFVPKTGGKISTMYSDRVLSFSFYEPDYERDVTADAYYMGLDRAIHVQRGAENIAVPDGQHASYGEAIAFFAEYFAAAIAGDAEAYNALFTDAYYKSVEPYERFAPQMIYGITVEELIRTEGINGDSYVFDVTYAIYKNDGTFRNDIDSGAFKTLIFELVPVGGELRINAIDYYRQG